jgi:MoxR-like ATPase
LAILHPFMKLIGRDSESAQFESALKLGKNLLLEGPVGVGKTHLVLSLLQKLKRGSVRIDGDARYSEQKLSGWFDPPLVLKKGYSAASFIEGPLTHAMRSGKVLFINELNRLPEGVQNILLPAIDEKKIQLPRLGEVKAKSGFVVVATQNPREFVATSHLSEALLDRFELIKLGYQSEQDEIAIVESTLDAPNAHEIAKFSVALARATRNHPAFRRGASVRAAMSLADFVAELSKLKWDKEKVLIESALMSLSTRVELERHYFEENKTDLRSVLGQMINDLPALAMSSEKKSLK